MQTLCKNLIELGCDGLFVLGSTGELFAADEDDRRTLTAAARAGCGNTATLYAGASGFGVRQTVRYAQFAAHDGADAVVVMAPFFVRLQQAELRDYLCAIADGAPLPVMLYHHMAMPTPMEIDTVARLAEHPNIVGIKDTGETADRVRALVQATHNQNFAIFQGREPFLLESLTDGAHGCVTALAGVSPEIHRMLFDAFHAQHHEQAQAIQARIVELWQLFRQPDIRNSFLSFTTVIRTMLEHRGLLQSTHGLFPDATQNQNIDKLATQYLKMLPTSDAGNLST